MDTAPYPTELSTTTSGGVRNDEHQTKESELEVAKVKRVTMPETGQPREQHVTAKSGSGSSRSLKLSIPDSEYESDGESGGGVRCASGVGVKGDGVEESSVDSGRGSRGSTPPVQEEEEEEGREDERTRKNVSIHIILRCVISPGS